MMVAEAVTFVGIDIGKFTCVAAAHGGAGCFSFAPDTAGIAQLLTYLRGLPGEVRVGFEASGGYEANLWEVLEAAGFDARQLAPARVHAYGRSQGRMAKTDASDAGMIAGYMAGNPDAGRRIAAENIRELSALSAKRRQLIVMRKALSCQSQQARHPGVDALNAELMAVIEAQISRLMMAMTRLVEADTGLAERRNLLETIPGIGKIASLTLLVEMPELGNLAPRAAAALAGLAPFNRDSGTASAKRFIRGGRATIRSVLYMAAITASVHNPSLKSFAERLKATHKPGKQIIIAVARKLIELANAVLKRGTKWQELPA